MRLVKPSQLPIQPKSRPKVAQWREWISQGKIDGKILPDGSVLIDMNRFIGKVDFTVQKDSIPDLLRKA